MKRRKTTRKAAPRRRRSVAAAPKRKTTRRVNRSRSMLSEFFDPKSAAAGAKVALSGAVGGVGAALLAKVLPTSVSAQNKAIAQVGAGFLTATMFRMPNIGAGMAAVGVVDLLRAQNLLGEDGSNMNYAMDMDSLPMVLNEGEAMYLSEDFPLSENYYLSEDDSEYSESAGSDYEVGYYPEFGGI